MIIFNKLNISVLLYTILVIFFLSFFILVLFLFCGWWLLKQ